MSKRVLPLLLVLTLVIAALTTLLAQNRQAGATADIPRLPFQTFTLSNGLKVIVSQDRRLPLTAVNLWYHVGPANEEPGRTGFAHRDRPVESTRAGALD